MSSISVKIWSRIRLKRVKSFLPSWACGLVGPGLVWFGFYLFVTVMFSVGEEAFDSFICPVQEHCPCRTLCQWMEPKYLCNLAALVPEVGI